MKKDNFDLRAYLVENKMTENSRGEARHHFGEANLDTRILTEGQGIDHHSDDYDEDYWSQEGADRLDQMWDDQGLDEGEGQFEIVPVEECGDVPSQPADGVVDECDAIGAELDEMDQELSEAGYTDDDFSDPDADAAVAAAFRDKGAKKAFDKDVAKDAEVKDFDADMENDPTDPAADFDDEEGDEPADEAPAAGGITVNDLIPGEGKKVEEMRANTEILVDLKDFFDEHPTYKLATLQRFIRNGFRAIKEFGYREVLLKPQAIGYDINNRRREDAVVRLTRPDSVSQYGDAEK